MALTKIFTGMEKGPEAIDANFGALNSDLNNNKFLKTDIRTMVTVGVQHNTNSPLKYWREGNTVHLQGGGKFPIETNYKWWSIPLGFRPSENQVVTVMAQSNHAISCVLRFQASGPSDITYNGDSANIIWLTTISWHTNDDFPN